jgi:hypothetical protein
MIKFTFMMFYFGTPLEIYKISSLVSRNPFFDVVAKVGSGRTGWDGSERTGWEFASLAS